MQFKALYLLALLAGLAAASPIPPPQGPVASSADGVAAAAGKSAGKVAAVTLPESVIYYGIKGAGGEPGPGQPNVSDGTAGLVGAVAKAVAPAFANGAVEGAGGKARPAGGA